MFDSPISCSRFLLFHSPNRPDAPVHLPRFGCLTLCSVRGQVTRSWEVDRKVQQVGVNFRSKGDHEYMFQEPPYAFVGGRGLIGLKKHLSSGMVVVRRRGSHTPKLLDKQREQGARRKFVKRLNGC